MSIRNCKRCGKIYQYNGVHKICDNCRAQLEKDFEEVKEFLKENPNSSISEVSEETGVEKKTIIEFIKNNRLIAEDLEIDVKIQCQRCGTEIKHGKYCDKCISDMKDEIDNVTKKEEKKNKRNMGEKNMHVSDRINKDK